MCWLSEFPRKIEMDREQRFGADFVLFAAFSPMLRTVPTAWWILHKGLFSDGMTLGLGWRTQFRGAKAQ